MEQIERIKQMELRMERAAKAVMELSAALDNYESVQEDIAELDNYYGSGGSKTMPTMKLADCLPI